MRHQAQALRVLKSTSARRSADEGTVSSLFAVLRSADSHSHERRWLEQRWRGKPGRACPASQPFDHQKTEHALDNRSGESLRYLGFAPCPLRPCRAEPFNNAPHRLSPRAVIASITEHHPQTSQIRSASVNALAYPDRARQDSPNLMRPLQSGFVA
jgi:hypothetical protein